MSSPVLSAEVALALEALDAEIAQYRNQSPAHFRRLYEQKVEILTGPEGLAFDVLLPGYQPGPVFRFKWFKGEREWRCDTLIPYADFDMAETAMVIGRDAFFETKMKRAARQVEHHEQAPTRIRVRSDREAYVLARQKEKAREAQASEVQP